MYGCNRANDTSGGMLRNSSSRWGRWPAGAHNLARQTTTTTNHETSVLTYCSAYALGGNDDNYLPHNKDNSKCAPIGPNKRLVLKRASARRCGKSYHKLPHGRPRCVRGRACPVGWWSSWEHTPSKLTTIKWVGPPFAHRRKWTKGVRTFRP